MANKNTDELQRMSNAAIKKARQAAVLSPELDEVLSLLNARLRLMESQGLEVAVLPAATTGWRLPSATSDASSAQSIGPATKPYESLGVSPDSSQAPSLVETWGYSRCIESIVTACEEYLSEALPKPNYHFSPIRQSEFCSFLKSTLLSHLTSGSNQAGSRGLADPNRCTPPHHYVPMDASTCACGEITLRFRDV